MAEDTLHYEDMTATAGASTTAMAAGANTVDPGSTGREGYFNFAKDLAAINRKNYRHTDNKGYPLAYVFEVELIGDTDRGYRFGLWTAPENWVLKNAIRKWHFARMAHMASLGFDVKDLGEYGRSIRPYLNQGHFAAATAGRASLKPSLWHSNDISYGGGSDYIASGATLTLNRMDGGDWTYTQLAHTVGAVDGQTQALAEGELVDKYSLMLTGDHIASSVSGESIGDNKWTAVSMTRAYMESRRNPMPPDSNSPSSAIQTNPNPLMQLMGDSASSRENLDIVQDIQREKPPYDALGTSSSDAVGGNDSINLVQKVQLSTTQSYLKDKDVIRVPAGLAYFQSTASGALSGSSTDTPSVRFKLLGIDKCQG